jgi:hypothetical protein
VNLSKNNMKGLSISENKNGGYRIFTYKTQAFDISDLDELTDDKIDEMTVFQNNRDEIQSQMIDVMFNDCYDLINEEVLNCLLKELNL